MGKQPIFGEKVVADELASGERASDDAVLLAVAAQQKEDLSLEGVARPIGIEVTQERVFLEDLQEDVGGQCLAEKARQGRFADPDGPFNGDIGVGGHGESPERAAVASLYTQRDSVANLKPLHQRYVWESVDTVDTCGGLDLGAQELLWLEQARRGDQAAFSRLVEAYQRPVYNLAYRMLGNAAEAEEAAQETFVRMYTKLHTYQAGRKLASWVLSIASHYCIDRLRRRRITWLSLDDDKIASVMPSRQPSPEELALRREACDEVQDCIAELEPGYQVPLILRYWQGLSYQEIAEVMGISVSAVKTRLHRSRLQIAGRAQAHPALVASTLALR